MIFLSVFAAIATVLVSAVLSCSGSYTVKSGDTLYDVAIRNNMSWRVVVLCNADIDANSLQPDQVISIPDCPRLSDATGYKIKEGDTLISIANDLDIDLGDILDCNAQLNDPDVIYPGDVLYIPPKN